MTAIFGQSSTITGPYNGTWNAMDLGLTETGFRIFHTNSGRDITSDMFGETVIDKIYTGTVVSVAFTLINWNAQAIEPMMWWMGDDAAQGYDWGRVYNIGQKHFDRARPLVLNSCFGISAAAIQGSPNPLADPVDITFPKTLLRPNEQIETLFSGTQPRHLDLVLDVFPYTFDSQEGGGAIIRPNACSAFSFFSATRNPVT